MNVPDEDVVSGTLEGEEGEVGVEDEEEDEVSSNELDVPIDVVSTSEEVEGVGVVNVVSRSEVELEGVVVVGSFNVDVSDVVTSSVAIVEEVDSLVDESKQMSEVIMTNGIT